MPVMSGSPSSGQHPLYFLYDDDDDDDDDDCGGGDGGAGDRDHDDDDGGEDKEDGNDNDKIHLVTKHNKDDTDESYMTLNHIFHGRLLFCIQQFIGYKKGWI